MMGAQVLLQRVMVHQSRDHPLLSDTESRCMACDLHRIGQFMSIQQIDR